MSSHASIFYGITVSDIEIDDSETSYAELWELIPDDLEKIGVSSVGSDEYPYYCFFYKFPSTDELGILWTECDFSDLDLSKLPTQEQMKEADAAFELLFKSLGKEYVQPRLIWGACGSD